MSAQDRIQQLLQGAAQRLGHAPREDDDLTHEEQFRLNDLLEQRGRQVRSATSAPQARQEASGAVVVPVDWQAEDPIVTPAPDAKVVKERVMRLAMPRFTDELDRVAAAHGVKARSTRKRYLQVRESCGLVERHRLAEAMRADSAAARREQRARKVINRHAAAINR